MREILIIFLIAFVAATKSTEDTEVIIADDSGDNYLDSFFSNWRLTKDEAITGGMCSEKAKGVFSFYDYSVVFAMLGTKCF